MSNARGIRNVLQNLNSQIRNIENSTFAGTVLAAAFVRAQSQRNTPVDTGNLRASHYTPIVFPQGTSKSVVIGLTANYAAYVHENTEARIQANRPQRQGAKFLERAVNDNKSRILSIVKREANRNLQLRLF